MFSFFLTCVTYAKSVLQFTLGASVLIGKVLFELLVGIVFKSSGVIRNILTTLQILLEDFGLFLRDLAEQTGFGFQIGSTIFEYIFRAVTFVYSSIVSSLQSSKETCFLILGSITNCYNYITTTVLFIITCVKKLMVLFGSGVWFLMTLIPVAIFSTCVVICYYIGVLFEELRCLKAIIWHSILDGLKSTIQFFIDVPLEAVMGLCFLGCIIYILHKFNQILCTFVLNKVNEAQQKISQKWLMPKFSTSAVTLPKNALPNEDSNVCVICHMNPKCMLILPCRHVCACEDCMKQIGKYSGRCPLCRTRVDRSILVYL